MEHFPDDKAKIRRAQIILTTIRGMIMTAKKVAEREGIPFGSGKTGPKLLGTAMFTSTTENRAGGGHEDASPETRLMLARMERVLDRVEACTSRVDTGFESMQDSFEDHRKMLEKISYAINPPLDAAAAAAKNMLQGQV
mmetsp:Transcript_72761/g.166968  ORF Transcript_72761/g.166968 Transcript_72761/m.166968 type:complete len:139 (-) Transcript_72761:340-756(-)